ncbi:hypothetical protein M8120_07020 [Microcystis aeruginosa str. Chao 1910]|uniref:hypothetical protein n=1 Tax=Microcystis aeruginosa TaxID=1126 RepID=UPI00224828B8|nr:hypothetical protein [Microcystis aeruginosa]UZO79131.1 hypothetical protein M8120_07020 [Microcystis aeruginosa str. Chao 1910]
MEDDRRGSSRSIRRFRGGNVQSHYWLAIEREVAVFDASKSLIRVFAQETVYTV